MIVLSFEPDGTGQGLFTEELPLNEIGSLEMRRASQVEFNEQAQVWEVTIKGQVYHRHESRQDCLNWEREYFNQLCLNT